MTFVYNLKELNERETIDTPNNTRIQTDYV